MKHILGNNLSQNPNNVSNTVQNISAISSFAGNVQNMSSNNIFPFAQQINRPAQSNLPNQTLQQPHNLSKSPPLALMSLSSTVKPPLFHQQVISTSTLTNPNNSHQIGLNGQVYSVNGLNNVGCINGVGQVGNVGNVGNGGHGGNIGTKIGLNDLPLPPPSKRPYVNPGSTQSTTASSLVQLPHINNGVPLQGWNGVGNPGLFQPNIGKNNTNLPNLQQTVQTGYNIPSQVSSTTPMYQKSPPPLQSIIGGVNPGNHPVNTNQPNHLPQLQQLQQQQQQQQQNNNAQRLLLPSHFGSFNQQQQPPK
jgi:hypothetical protein